MIGHRIGWAARALPARGARGARLLSLAAAMLVAAACGSGGPTDEGNGGNDTGGNDPGGGGGGGGGGGALTANVAMLSSDEYGDESNAFSPLVVNLAVNGSVTWTNSTGFTHNVTFITAGAPANVANLSSGMATRTFPAAGTFEYQCTNHSGMNGSVIVAP